MENISKQIICGVVLSIIFWLLWSISGIGEKYFYFLPETFRDIPASDSICIFTIITTLRLIIFPHKSSVIINNNIVPQKPSKVPENITSGRREELKKE